MRYMLTLIHLFAGFYKPTNVISISWGTEETLAPAYYQKRQVRFVRSASDRPSQRLTLLSAAVCNEWLKLALRGVSVFFDSGDFGSSCEIRNTTDGGQR